MHNEPRTVCELMVRAASALEDRDTDTLEQLITVNDGWLQTVDERNSLHRLLESMLAAAYELE
jgi:hypothetical protein